MRGPVYEAGAADTLRHAWKFRLAETGLDSIKTTMAARMVEFWCQRHCRADWRVEQEPSGVVTISFDADPDAVHFCLGAFYDRYAGVSAKA